jgi:KDO2-lipid IV(A) lauroyltransferase
LSKKRESITFNNIKHAFPYKDHQECTRLTALSYQNLGIVLLEISAMPFLSDTKIKSMMSFPNIDIVHTLLQKGKGIILISAHIGNWELLAYAAGLVMQQSVLLVAKEQRNPLIHKAITSLRQRAGNRTVSMEKAAKPLINSLKENKPIALLVDQAADPKKDVFLPFFGRKAAVFEAPASLSLRYDAPLVLCIPHRNSYGHYTVTMKEIKSDDLSFSKENIFELTQRHLKELEHAIEQAPEQWTWQHNRWKYEA